MTWSEFVTLPEESDWTLLVFVGNLIAAIREMPSETEDERRAQEWIWEQGMRAFEGR